MESITKIFEDTIIPEDIIKNIEATIGKNIDNTVIFIDEIQVSQRAITSLKYFCESEKNYKIVVVGSLLGVKINRFENSFPVGKVWIDFLFPMDYEEFLMAVEKSNLLELIKQNYKNMTPMLESTHKKALSLYNDYLCIGDMPSAIKNYIEHNRNVLGFENNIKSISLCASFFCLRI